MIVLEQNYLVMKFRNVKNDDMFFYEICQILIISIYI